MKRKYGFFLFFLLALQMGIAGEVSCAQEIVSCIERNFSNSGVLSSSPNGFFYVKVDDGYVHQLNEFVHDMDFEKPPYFGELYDSGAHISVIYPNEINGSIPEITELGESILFQVTGCEIFQTPDWEGIEQVYVVLVDSPALDQLRKKYGFFEEPNFHITIGVKRTLKSAA
ncbi:MAG: hypothetical protein V4487_01345 [Chlamydiota bacterium]